MIRRSVRWLVLLLLVGIVLYFPVRREMVERGVVAAGRFRANAGEDLILYGNGRYSLRRNGVPSEGTFTIEKFPDAPWISLVRLDIGLVLHVRYDDHVYRVEDIPRLETASDVFVRE